MDAIVKKKINHFFTKNYSSVYKTTPVLKSEGNNYFYTTNKENNVICLIPINKL
jgi:hypothetical protein